MMTALRSLLRSGKAHIANSAATGGPPIIEADSGDSEMQSWAPRINSQLGWTMHNGGEYQSHGTKIGELVQKSCGYVVLFYPQEAYTAAYDNYRGDLIKGGESRDGMWDAVIAANHTFTEADSGFYKRGNGSRWFYTKIGGKESPQMVPISLSTLLDTDTN